MLARQLDYSPKAEELPLVVEVMVRDLQALNLTDDDSDRVAAAFQAIALNSHRWPTVYMIRENLPPREANRSLEASPLDRVKLEYLKKIGMDRQPGESMPEYATRCCRFMREQIRRGEIDVTPTLERAINERANAD